MPDEQTEAIQVADGHFQKGHNEDLKRAISLRREEITADHIVAGW